MIERDEGSLSVRAQCALLGVNRSMLYYQPCGVKASDGAISMDGRGRAFDNIFVERLWRSVKYEEVYLKDYGMVDDARRGLRDYFALYNTERLHQSLGYKTPAEVYFGREAARADFLPGVPSPASRAHVTM